ncbi:MULTISPECIES: DUF5366 family protein [Metabacillus]|jgi:hypothetical protein|uniref:Membrane protein n=1 Tax=Metabacillus indicus TaxID=246786 RepID=A0A084GKD5_METID|nr:MULTISPECIES: DUF5366 family protein [Metabacillus]KEZ47797.1 membrane protein [Metabacillus indicus]KEZ48410.1 membrane protein [Metabacillus indicus LMG 22858]
MKNTYFTSYFPLIAILLFSTSLSISTVSEIVGLLKRLGVYGGMLEFFSESGIKLALFTVFALIYFMVFSALKLISDTVTELSLLFFSKDAEGESLKKIRLGSAFYLAGGGVSLLLVQFGAAIIAVFLLATVCYFIFAVYQFSFFLTSFSLIGLVLFHVLFWSVFLFGILYICMKLYNSLLASLPI